MTRHYTRQSLDRWVHRPRGIDVVTIKSAYGHATSEGKVLINDAFLGTEAINKLDNTIRHELAHLAAGLSRNHNKVFKAFARSFGVDLSKESEAGLRMIIDNVSFKYTVYAHLDNGAVINLGGVHRKTKAYSQYPEHSGKNRSIDGVRVERFEFVEN